jgi:class 3 adenylate cyclase
MVHATPSRLDQASDPSRRLRWHYLVTLTVVAIFVASGTLTIFLLVGLLKTDPSAINEAGRQRMLSQRFTKDALRLRYAASPEVVRASLGYLRETMGAWARGHERLWHEVESPSGLFSDNGLRAALLRVDLPYQVLREAGRELLAACDLSTGSMRDRDVVERAVDRILDQEPIYLTEMDGMVSLYEEKASSRVKLLRYAAILFSLTGVLILGACALFLLEPATRLIRKQFLDVRKLLEDTRGAEHQLKERNEYIKDVFGRYVSDEVVHRLLDNPGGLDLGGEERKVTLLMSDLRGFSSLASTLPPRKTVQLLNQYLDRMTKVIDNHDGTIGDFLGDCIFTIFGAPLVGERDARHAAACALSMQLELEHINDTFEDEGLPRLQMGIGIHTGNVIAGNVGSAKRAKYGVVGPVVNLTSRLEECALSGQVLISEATLKEVGEEAEVAKQRPVIVKGFEELVQVYELIGLKGMPQINRIRKEEPLLALLRGKCPICYRRVAEDQVGNDVFRGEISGLSSEQVEVQSITVHRCPYSPDGSNVMNSCPLLPAVAVQDDIELSLGPTIDRILATTVYATVTEVFGVGRGAFRARFTSVSPAARAIINSLLKSTPQRLESSEYGTSRMS